MGKYIRCYEYRDDMVLDFMTGAYGLSLRDDRPRK